MTVDEFQAVHPASRAHSQLPGGDLKRKPSQFNDSETNPKVLSRSSNIEHECEKKDKCKTEGCKDDNFNTDSKEGNVDLSSENEADEETKILQPWYTIQQCKDLSPSSTIEYESEKKAEGKDEFGNNNSTAKSGRDIVTNQEETEKFKTDSNETEKFTTDSYETEKDKTDSNEGNVVLSSEIEADEETKFFRLSSYICRDRSQIETDTTSDLPEVNESDCETQSKDLPVAHTLSPLPDTCQSISKQSAASDKRDSLLSIPIDRSVTRPLSKHDKTMMNNMVNQNSAPLSGGRWLEKMKFDNLNKKLASTSELLTSRVDETDTNINHGVISNVIDSASTSGLLTGRVEESDSNRIEDMIATVIESVDQQEKKDMLSMATGAELIEDSNTVWESNKITREEAVNMAADAGELYNDKGDLELMEKRKKTKKFKCNSAKISNTDCAWTMKKNDVVSNWRKLRQSKKPTTAWRRPKQPLYKKLQRTKKRRHFQPDNISPVGSSPIAPAQQSGFKGHWKCRGHSQGGKESSGNSSRDGEGSDSVNGGSSNNRQRRGQSDSEGSANNDRNQFNSPEKNFKKHRAKEGAEATQVSGTTRSDPCLSSCLQSCLNPQNKTHKLNCCTCNEKLIPILKHFAKCQLSHFECDLCKYVIELITSHLRMCKVVRSADTEEQSGLSCPLKICRFVADERLKLDSAASISDHVVEILGIDQNVNEIKKYLCLFYEIRRDKIKEKGSKVLGHTSPIGIDCPLDSKANESLDNVRNIPTGTASNYPQRSCSHSPEQGSLRSPEQGSFRRLVYGLSRCTDRGLSQCPEQEPSRPTEQGLERSLEQRLGRPSEQILVQPSLQGLGQPSEQGIGQHNLRRLEHFVIDSSLSETVYPLRSLPTQHGRRSFTECEELSKLASLGQALVQYGFHSQLLKCVVRWEELYRAEQFQVDRDSTDGVILRQFQSLHISRGRYEEDSQWFTAVPLGTGAFGACFLALDIKTERKFCVKKVHLRKFKGDEVRTLMRLNNPYIVQLYGAVRFDSTIYMFSEFVNGICVLERIQNEGRLNAWEALVYLKQLLDVLIYLKQKHILHEDLKAENVMLQGGQFRVVVVDFGVSRLLEPPEFSVSCTDIVGTQTQFSPEKARGEPYSYGADLWALICIFVHMLSGSPPWIKRYSHAKILVFLIGTQSPPREDIPHGLPEELNNLIMSGWQVDPKRRPTAEDLVKHGSFQMLDNLAPADPWFRGHLRAPSPEAVPGPLSAVPEPLSDHGTYDGTYDSTIHTLEDKDLPNLPEFQSALQIEVVSQDGTVICTISLDQADVDGNTWSNIVGGIGEHVFEHYRSYSRFTIVHDDQTTVGLDNTLLDAQQQLGRTIQVIAKPVKTFNCHNWCFMRDGIQYDNNYQGNIVLDN